MIRIRNWNLESHVAPPATGQLTEAGGVVLPAAPGFYHRPERIDQLVDFVVQRVLDRLPDIEVADRWTGDTSID